MIFLALLSLLGPQITFCELDEHLMNYTEILVIFLDLGETFMFPMYISGCSPVVCM